MLKSLLSFEQKIEFVLCLSSFKAKVNTLLQFESSYKKVKFLLSKNYINATRCISYQTFQVYIHNSSKFLWIQNLYYRYLALQMYSVLTTLELSNASDDIKWKFSCISKALEGHLNSEINSWKLFPF